jgi:glycosyltransferase involved in cell wall biosynthesis
MVTPRFPPYSGGVELHVAEVARRIAKMGHVITVLTTDPSGALPAKEQQDGVEIERVRAWPRQRDYYFAPGIWNRVVRSGSDVVHVQSYHTFVAPMAMAAARRAEIPYVLTFHAGGHSSSTRRALRGVQFAALRPLLARAAALVALAPFEVERYSQQLRLPRERFAVIPNGADLPVPRRARGADGRGPVIASLGRLERYKGHQHVLAAFPAILRERPNARLWIAGTGPYAPELEQLAQRLGVTDRTDIHAVPPEDRARMADELAQVDVAVLASDFETHPIAMLEAASLGCGLVVADSPGLRELGAEGIAHVVAHADQSDELAAAVLAELDKPRAAPALKLPSWDACAEKLCALYAAVTDAPPTSRA